VEDDRDLLVMAVKSKHLPLVKWLLGSVPVGCVDSFTAAQMLFAALRNGDDITIEYLLSGHDVAALISSLTCKLAYHAGFEFASERVLQNLADRAQAGGGSLDLPDLLLALLRDRAERAFRRLLQRISPADVTADTREVLVIVATEQGNTAVLQSLLDTGLIDTHAFIPDCLRRAVESNSLSTVQLVLTHASAAGVWRDEVVFRAAAIGNGDMLKMLLAFMHQRNPVLHADLEARFRSDGPTGVVLAAAGSVPDGVVAALFILAAQHGHLAAVTALCGQVVQPGIDPRVLALRRAIKDRHRSVVEFLLQSMEQKNPHSALFQLQHGAIAADPEILTLLCHYCAKRKPTNGFLVEVWQAFSTAAFRGLRQCCAVLLSLLRQVPNVPDTLLQALVSPMALHEQDGGVWLVCTVLEASASLPDAFHGGNYLDIALEHAADAGQEGIARLLLEVGANASEISQDALSQAEQRGQTSLVSLLVSRGAQVPAVG